MNMPKEVKKKESMCSLPNVMCLKGTNVTCPKKEVKSARFQQNGQ